MKRNIIVTAIALLLCVYSWGQRSPRASEESQGVARPKLVVGIVVDQMRWDYLYRFNALYSANGGFKRLLNEGFSCENTFIPYIPTVTAVGHSCIYTGSVPAINGITGNSWYDNVSRRGFYCTDDSTVETVGSETVAVGKMSPRNLLVTTIGDELRLATNFRSKVIGVSCKDRASILPAGHAANAAYWYDGKSGNFVSSTYYLDSLPQWATAFNHRKVVDSLYRLNWSPLLSEKEQELYADDDDVPYENAALAPNQNHFPFDLAQFAGKDYGKIMNTPYANTLTVAMAEAAIRGENLGKSGATDMLTVSFSSPDYIGHATGPNSREQLDDYLRLDKELGRFLSFLDTHIGKGNYTVFLSADHGVAHVAGYLEKHQLPGGLFPAAAIRKDMNEQLRQKYGFGNIILSLDEYQVVFNNELLDRTENINREDLTNWIVNYLGKRDEVAAAIPLNRLSQAVIPEVWRTRIANGYYARRSGQIQIIPKPGYYDGGSKGTTHGAWNPYDSHIPLVWYGWGIRHGALNRETYMTDISATLAALLHIQMPSGCVGQPITELMK